MQTMNVNVLLTPEIQQGLADGTFEIAGLAIRNVQSGQMAAFMPVVGKAMGKAANTIKKVPPLILIGIVVLAGATATGVYLWNHSQQNQQFKTLERVQKTFNQDLQLGEVRLETIQALHQELGVFSVWWQQNAPDQAARHHEPAQDCASIELGCPKTK
jgi:hypothetical protein